MAFLTRRPDQGDGREQWLDVYDPPKPSIRSVDDVERFPRHFESNSSWHRTMILVE
jgi:hypothetical protein